MPILSSKRIGAFSRGPHFINEDIENRKNLIFHFTDCSAQVTPTHYYSTTLSSQFPDPSYPGPGSTLWSKRPETGDRRLIIICSPLPVHYYMARPTFGSRKYSLTKDGSHGSGIMKNSQNLLYQSEKYEQV